MLTLPAALALAILAVPLLATLFQHGAFTANDVLETRTALVAYSVGLAGLIAPWRQPEIDANRRS